MKIVLILTIVAMLLLTACGQKYPAEQMDAFAQCVTEAGTTMYGAFWCPHCARTKKMFGSSFQYIDYVECDPNGDNEQAELCIEKEIDKYDTWEFADGSRHISEPTLELLAEKTGCPMPQEAS